MTLTRKQLWESHAKPPLYHFTSKYHGKRGATPKHHRPSPCQSPLDRELALFAAFFRRKTGVAWEDRVALAGTMGPEFFVYEPPVRFPSSSCLLSFSPPLFFLSSSLLAFNRLVSVTVFFGGGFCC